MPKKEMNLDFALDLLYQEATSEETKYTQKQKETAYNVLKGSIYILGILRKWLRSPFGYDILEDHEKETFDEWLKK